MTAQKATGENKGSVLPLSLLKWVNHGGLSNCNRQASHWPTSNGSYVKLMSRRKEC